MIATAPLRLRGWVRAIDEADIPILERSALAIASLQADEDNVSARDIAELAQEGPLRSLRILAHATRRRSSHMSSEAETVTACLLMMGTTAFFRACAQAPTVESRLADMPVAMEGLRRVIDRSHRAARLAIGFAMHRQDTDAEVIHEAALLHDFAELLLWCHAPQLALDIRSRQRADPTLRSAQVQREVLHIELADLEQALMRAWHLPELLRELTDPNQGARPRVRNVMLATALARHSQHGWNNAALPDDFEALGQLLNLTPLAVRSLVRDIDLTAADVVC